MDDQSGRNNSVEKQESPMKRRRLQTLLLLFGSITLFCAASAVFPYFDTEVHRQVYAGDSQDMIGTGEQQFQTGLMGVINGVADMERYSQETRLLDYENTNEKILAGFRAVNRQALQKNSISASQTSAGTLSYYAQLAVHENQMSENDYYSLLKIVEAEATDADLVSKMMVAGVVLNRVMDERFPDNVCAVINQSSQFQPMSDGRFYSVTVTDSTIEAVDRVMEGEDYTKGALFFCARDSSDKSNMEWFDSSLEKLFEYGGHEYFTFQS